MGKGCSSTLGIGGAALVSEGSFPVNVAAQSLTLSALCTTINGGLKVMNELLGLQVAHLCGRK